MNCLDCQELLQARLDGVPPDDRDDPGASEHHLAVCAECRGWYAAAQRLEDGLRLARPPAAPDDLADRIVAGVLADRRRRTRRWAWARGAAALAASLLVVFLLGPNGPMAVRNPTPGPRPGPAAPSESASLRESVVEAGSAVVSLTTRTADKTVGQGRLLLPVVVAKVPENPMPSPMDPPVRSLRDAGQGLSAGLQPVTSSARRAFDLFLREMPPMDPEDKPGT
jgi:hypothetical protein